MPLIFQYGSNTDSTRLNDPTRLDGAAVVVGRAQTVEEYDIAFDVWSKGNGCAASDLRPAPGTGRHAWGVLYEVPKERLLRKDTQGGGKTLEGIEGGKYTPRSIRVRKDGGKEVEATTFLVKEGERLDGLRTSHDYVRHIVEGLRSHEIPEEYVQHVIDVALETNRKAGERAEAGSELIRAMRVAQEGRVT